MPRLHSGAAIDTPVTNDPTLPPIPEVVWQQPLETHLINIHKFVSTETHKITHTLEFKNRNDVESQTSPIGENSPQVSISSAEPFLETQTGSTSVQCLNDSKKRHPEIQRIETNLKANDNGDGNISPLKIATSQIEKRLVRDDFTKEL